METIEYDADTVHVAGLMAVIIIIKFMVFGSVKFLKFRHILASEKQFSASDGHA